jgi:hypothetical protein
MNYGFLLKGGEGRKRGRRKEIQGMLLLTWWHYGDFFPSAKYT